MSRFGSGDDYDSNPNLWLGAVARATNGKRGQRGLRFLEQALLALPEKRLIEGEFVSGDPRGGDGHPQVCALGAAAWWNLVQAGWDSDRAFAELPQLETEFETSEWAAAHLDIAYALAFSIAWENDEGCWGETPEQRYESMLRWVRSQIKSESAA